MSVVSLLKNNSEYAKYQDIRPGCWVKLHFDSGFGVEGLWVRVIAHCVGSGTGAGTFAGRLDNRPFFVELSYGDAVIFKKHHVYSVRG